MALTSASRSGVEGCDEAKRLSGELSAAQGAVAADPKLLITLRTGGAVAAVADPAVSAVNGMISDANGLMSKAQGLISDKCVSVPKGSMEELNNMLARLQSSHVRAEGKPEEKKPEDKKHEEKKEEKKKPEEGKHEEKKKHAEKKEEKKEEKKGDGT